MPNMAVIVSSLVQYKIYLYLEPQIYIDIYIAHYLYMLYIDLWTQLHIGVHVLFLALWFVKRYNFQ
jgi:hypothetical protein